MKEATVDITVMLIAECVTRAAVFLMIEEAARLTEEYVNFPRVLIVLSFKFKIHVTEVYVQASEVESWCLCSGASRASCLVLLCCLAWFYLQRPPPPPPLLH